MTESQWLVSDDPWSMLCHLLYEPSRNHQELTLRVSPLATDRKLYLFAVALSRHLGPDGPPDRHAEALANAEHMAEGRRVNRTWAGFRVESLSATRAANLLLDDLCGPEESQLAADLLREVIGNPFRPRLPRQARRPGWLTHDVVAVASNLYGGGYFGFLTVLADALEEARCPHPELVEHLRAPGPHVRGCWAVDFVLGQK
jgi:hypothetical protein